MPGPDAPSPSQPPGGLTRVGTASTLKPNVIPAKAGSHRPAEHLAGTKVDPRLREDDGVESADSLTQLARSGPGRRGAVVIPHGVAAPETAADDPRLGHWLARQSAVTDETRVALVGFPSDAGVVRNGGRPGAADGPAALRRALYKLTPDARAAAPFEALLARTADLGDVPVSGDVERDQAALGRTVAALLDRGVFPLVLGGGHETLYGHALGYLETGRPVHLLNWDAHADVRPLIVGANGVALGHSGSPFRQALEHPSGLARGYTVAGLQPWRVAAAHAAFVRQHGRLVWVNDLEDTEALVADLAGPTLASFDLDAVDGVSGVSAPNVAGIPVSVWLRAAEACGRSANVTSADVVELSPPHDASGQAATLAALTVWHLLLGLAGRDGHGG